AALRLEDHRVARGGAEGTSEHVLAAAPSVDVGMVEEGRAEIDGRLHEALRRVRVEAMQTHTADGDDWDVQVAGAEGDRAHVAFRPLRPAPTSPRPGTSADSPVGSVPPAPEP